MGLFDSIKKKAKDLGIDTSDLDNVSVGGMSLGDIRKVVSEAGQVTGTVKDAISEFTTSVHSGEKPMSDSAEAAPAVNTCLTPEEVHDVLSDLPEAHNVVFDSQSNEVEAYFIPDRNDDGVPVVDPFISARLDGGGLIVRAGYMFSSYDRKKTIDLSGRLLDQIASVLAESIGGGVIPCTASRKALVYIRIPFDQIKDEKALWNHLYNMFCVLNNTKTKAKNIYFDAIGCGSGSCVSTGNTTGNHEREVLKPRPFIATLESVKEIMDELAGGDKVSLDTLFPVVILSGKSSKTTGGDLLLSPSVLVEIKDGELSISTGYYLNRKFADEYIDIPESFAVTIAEKLGKAMGEGYSADLSRSKPKALKKIPLASATDRASLKKEIQHARKVLNDLMSECTDRYITQVNESIREKKEKKAREEERMRDISSMLSAARSLMEEKKRLDGVAAEEARRREAEEVRIELQRETDAEAERRRGLADGFTYTLRSNGTIRGLQEAFTEDYPYLRIGVYMVKTGEEANRYGGEITSYDSDTRFGDIRSFKGDCKLEINGNDTPEELERYFRKNSGLVIKICYNDEDDHRYYISKDSENYTMYIYDLNRKFRDDGYEKADIS